MLRYFSVIFYISYCSCESSSEGLFEKVKVRKALVLLNSSRTEELQTVEEDHF